MNHLTRLLPVASFALVASLSAQTPTSGTGSISGRVTDASNQLALKGARVTVAGSALQTFTDEGGFFTINGAPTGAQYILVSYVGYPDLNRAVTVSAGQVANAAVAFGSDSVQMDRFVITGNAVGTARGINQQRAAETLTNIIAADDIGRFPDQNAAESMQRIPGLSLYRDQGEGRFIVLRGIRPDLNSTQLNGVSIASPERGSRTVALDVLPTDALGSVEVTKVPTPDQDVDGLGGRIDMKTKSAFDADGRQLQVSAQGQYNHLRDRLSGKYNGTYSDTFADGKIGVIFSPTWQGRRFGSDNFEVSNPWVSRAVPGTTTGQTAFFNQDINYREYEITRTRYGANAALEFKPDSTSYYYVRGTYSYFSDNENRYVTTIPFSEASTVTALTDVSASVTGVRRENKQLRVRTKTQDLYAVSAGGEKSFGDWKVDARAAYSLGKEEKPEDSVIFRKSTRGSNWSYSFAPGTYAPIVTQTAGTSITDPTLFDELNRLRTAPGTGKETESNVGGNLRRDFTLAGGTPGYVKFGGQARLKTKEQEREQVNWTAPTSFTFSSLAQPQSDDDYSFMTGPRINAEAFTQTFIDNKTGYTPTRDVVSSMQDDWKSNEDIYAAYGMGSLTWGRLNVMSGARYERTEFEAKGNVIRTTGSTTTITPSSRSRSYDNVLPGIYLRLDADKKTVFRASWSNSIARPAFSETALRRTVSDDSKLVTESNPGLKALESINWDASVEHYFSSLGMVSASVFHKQISNFTYQATLPGVTDPETGYGLNTYINGTSGRITGLELAWQQQFTLLPAPFNGLGALVNYTVTDSVGHYLRSATGTIEEAPFIGQSRQIANVALSYEKHGFFVRAALNYRSPRLREDEAIGANADADRYVDVFHQIDLTASYKLNRQIEFFGEVLNITNEPFRVAFGKDRSRFLQFEEYGWSANAGVRWKL